MDAQKPTDAEIRATMTSEQILLERKLTCEAINGAMAFGYQDSNPPPSDDHWLAPFWKIGRQQAELESRVALAPSDAVQAPSAWMLQEPGQSKRWYTSGEAAMQHWVSKGASATPLYAAPVAPAAAPSEWQPIETVPKDGTEVALLFAADIEILGEIHPRVRAASWRGDWSIPYSRNNPPTHWAHLPAAPQGAAQ